MYNLEFLFIEPPLSEPVPAISHVALKHAHTPTYVGIQSQPVLTPGCFGPDELDGQIDRLQAELESIRKLAHERYAAFQRRGREP